MDVGALLLEALCFPEIRPIDLGVMSKFSRLLNAVGERLAVS